MLLVCSRFGFNRFPVFDDGELVDQRRFELGQSIDSALSTKCDKCDSQIDLRFSTKRVLKSRKSVESLYATCTPCSREVRLLVKGARLSDDVGPAMT